LNGSVGNTLKNGFDSYKDLNKFLKSSANFYKGKAFGGGDRARSSIKSLIKGQKLPTKGKIRYVPPKKLCAGNG
jgi:hypothetical protein